MNRFVFTYQILILILLSACGQVEKKDNSTFSIQRFDQQLFDTISISNDEIRFDKLDSQYGEFLNGFAHQILEIPDSGKAYRNAELGRFIRIAGVGLIKKDIDSVFKSGIQKESDELADALERYVEYFPKAKKPKVLTYLSGFGIGNVTLDSTLGIGLDFYLGADYPVYPAVGFPKYMTDKLRREYMVANTLKVLGIGQFDHQLKDKRFLAYMLFEGKIRYFIKQLDPDIHDTILLGYSERQYNWALKNEAQIWTHYIDKKLLYCDEPPLYMRYLNDGPFTTAEGVPQESSPAIGVFTGYRIIEKYANKSGANLSELINESDWDKILKISEYRPTAP